MYLPDFLPLKVYLTTCYQKLEYFGKYESAFLIKLTLYNFIAHLSIYIVKYNTPLIFKTQHCLNNLTDFGIFVRLWVQKLVEDTTNITFPCFLI